MKKLIVVAMLIATLGISSVAYTQRHPKTRQKSTDGKVTAVKLALPGNPPRCDWVQIHGVITTDGPAEVKFKWVIGSIERSGVETLKFLHGGSKKLSIVAPIHLPRGSSIQIKVLSPNEVLSNKVPIGELCG
jgi:hypothetical protein